MSSTVSESDTCRTARYKHDLLQYVQRPHLDMGRHFDKKCITIYKIKNFFIQ
jgi:hypothetical protein